jgi:heme exporter protein A
LCGIAPPAQGEVYWRGERVRGLREEYWRELVYIGHASALKDDLTALENLEVVSALCGRPAPDGAGLDALFQFDVEGCATLPARALSQGQRRRVALARLALSTGAPLWVLDEPFSALDPSAVQFVERLIGDQLARGGTVVYTTHQEVAIEATVSLCIDLGT